MSKAKELAKKKPEIRKVVTALIDISSEHNVCCLDLGRLFSQIDKRFKQAAAAGVTNVDLETDETRSLKSLASKESSICYRMGLKYNELRGILGREDTEALIADEPMLECSEAALFGKVAEQFSEAQAVANGIHKMVQLVEYAELNGMTLGDTDPGATEISLLQNDGRWKRRKLRDCRIEDLEQTVIALKTQRGIPVDDPWDSIDLELALGKEV